MKNLFKVIRASYYKSVNFFSDFETPKRRVENYEIELYETSGNISVLNGVEYKQKCGNILLAKPGDIRNSKGEFECHCVHFFCYDTEISEILNSLSGVFEASDSEEVKKLLKKLSAPAKLDNSSKRLYIQGIFLELIGVLASEKNKIYSGKYSSYASEVEKACAFMENNFPEHLTLSEIAATVHLSPIFFHGVFKEIKKLSPAEYLFEIRISKAKAFLRENNMSLAEIALFCGFGSQSYFSYTFKKRTGLTPKEYRDKKKIII